MAGRVTVRQEILREILLHARREPELECCGLLAGRDAIITTIFPATNALASPAAYEIAPLELFRLFRTMHEQDLTHLGIYHSHPNTENKPSASDIRQAYYPDQVYFIVSPRPESPNPIRAFFIRDASVEEITIEEVPTGGE